MTDPLREKIRVAQVMAGERAVMDHLAEMGHLTTSKRKAQRSAEKAQEMTEPTERDREMARSLFGLPRHLRYGGDTPQDGWRIASGYALSPEKYAEVESILNAARKEGRLEERERCGMVLDRLGRYDEAYTIRNPH